MVCRTPRGLQVATLVQADWLFLLTDVPNLFTANPNTDPTAQPIYEVADLSKLHVSASASKPARLKTVVACAQPAAGGPAPRAAPRTLPAGRALRPTHAPTCPTRRWTRAHEARSGAPAAWPPS